jgi:hypothetical protein
MDRQEEQIVHTPQIIMPANLHKTAPLSRSTLKFGHSPPIPVSANKCEIFAHGDVIWSAGFVTKAGCRNHIAIFEDLKIFFIHPNNFGVLLEQDSNIMKVGLAFQPKLGCRRDVSKSVNLRIRHRSAFCIIGNC